MADLTRYCNYCDQETAEWNVDDFEGVDVCPVCTNTLWASREAYVDEMVRWLPMRTSIDADDVEAFLRKHGNPGKGQALAILR